MAEPPAEQPSAEVEALRERMGALEEELRACQSRLEREKKLRLKAQAGAAKLRRQVRASVGCGGGREESGPCTGPGLSSHWPGCH